MRLNEGQGSWSEGDSRSRQTALRRRAGARGRTRGGVRLGESEDTAHRGEKIAASLPTHAAKQVVAVAIALVNRGRGGAAARATARMVRALGPPRAHSRQATSRMRCSSSGSGCLGNRCLLGF